MCGRYDEDFESDESEVKEAAHEFVEALEAEGKADYVARHSAEVAESNAVADVAALVGAVQSGQDWQI